MQCWVVRADIVDGVGDHLPLGDVCLVRAHWLHVPSPPTPSMVTAAHVLVLHAVTHHHGAADRGTSLAGPDT